MPATVAARPSFPDASVDPRLVDAVLAAAMGAVVALAVAADLEGTGRAGPATYLFAAGLGALLLLRRRLPRVVLVLTVFGIFSYYIFDLPPIGLALPAVAALFSAAERAHTRAAVAAAAALVVVAAYFRVEEGLPGSYLFSYDLLTDVALAAAAIALGVSVRARGETRRHQERLRSLAAAEERNEARRRLESERVGIARDLHDTVGHALSVIAVHSNVAAEALGRDNDAAAQALGQIQAASSATLRELRNTVKILRSPASGPAERDGLGLSGLPQLVTRAREAGLDVSADVDVAAGALDAGVDAAAYRIVQESLTNVLRHAGARHAWVSARLRDGMLELSITDDGVRQGGAGPGRGLQGMAERAGLLGGRFSAGARSGGGFEVRATLPGALSP
ncbi:sensor histidine kinase [Arthrobacter sp. zg-Y895]|uniref:sensor histidine kinase n=1 Tax=Arthrobacter sp. zg-Y895 TaxID=2886933 RepID=UPI001D15C602|nr:sensor histidine kinase [Arthrobacter sp. zg-Y895]MCC3301608.1 sensor histidine kinase [Arthrobacter sp. zg-Y895]